MSSHLFRAPKSPYLVPFDDSFRVAKAATGPRTEVSRKDEEKRLAKAIKKLRKLQRVLYADDRHALLLVFQAMDAAGKDGTVQAVMSGVNPAGCQVYSFKAPSAEELDHDFLWRVYLRLPERGRIGIFNRSHYEEVLVVRVHPEHLDAQNLPRRVRRPELWRERYRSIRHMEEHLAANGTVILKFWLNVSREEQRKRFIARIEDPKKHWKFSARDIEEAEHWDKYMEAYEDALNATSREWAPWYAVPADDKPFMRATVAEIVVDALTSLDMRFPGIDDSAKAVMHDAKQRIEAEASD
jgi:PPK2 family polyphosphate:nucleotide phosphotransferase